MIITLSAKLKKAEFITDNRPSLVSFLKNAFSEYGNGLFEKYYAEHKNILKSFCFSMKLSNPVFKGEIIDLSDEKIEITINTYDPAEGIDIYNALVKQRGKAFPLPNQNSMTVSDVSIRNHKPITSNTIMIKMRSPLLVRKHDGKKDRYLTPDSEEFNEFFQLSVKDFLTKESIDIPGDIEIIPVKPKKTVPVAFGYKISGNLGTYILRGDVKLLNLLYQSGIGARRSQGFGAFEII